MLGVDVLSRLPPPRPYCVSPAGWVSAITSLITPSGRFWVALFRLGNEQTRPSPSAERCSRNESRARRLPVRACCSGSHTTCSLLCAAPGGLESPHPNLPPPSTRTLLLLVVMLASGGAEAGVCGGGGGAAG